MVHVLLLFIFRIYNHLPTCRVRPPAGGFGDRSTVFMIIFQILSPTDLGEGRVYPVFHPTRCILFC